MTKKDPETTQRLRFASYARYSTEMQNELSITEQLKCCRNEIAKRGGVVVAEFSDDAQSGWSVDRKGLNDLRAFAAAKKVDAIMFWKFDRLMREHDQTVVLKLLLRREYGVKLYCVEGFSEDDDNSPYTAMMEQMLAVFSAFYSKNLSIDTKRAKRARAERGDFNGSTAPIGYTLVTKKSGNAEEVEGLHIDPRLAAIVRRAFRLYATGAYSDATLAAWMMQQREVQKYRQGQKPIDKEAVRHMLQNQVYTGRVSHSDTVYNGGLGQRRKGYRHRREWFEGKHRPIITDSLFTKCQEVRASLYKYHKTTEVMRTYALHDKLYCAHCIAQKPIGIVDDNYGRMRPYYHNANDKAYYRCTSGMRGYGACRQSHMEEVTLHEQLVAILSSLTIPKNFEARLEAAIRARVEHEVAFKRMEEIREMVGRIDLSWENGFIDKQEYLEKRQRLNREWEALRPIDYDVLMESYDLLRYFNTYWRECGNQDNPAEARKQLVSKIVDRIFVHNKQIVALVLHGDFAIVVGENEKASAEIADALHEVLYGSDVVTTVRSQIGADGFRTRDLCLDRAIC